MNRNGSHLERNIPVLYRTVSLLIRLGARKGFKAMGKNKAKGMNRYEISGQEVGVLNIFATTPAEAEKIARTLFGADGIYKEPKSLRDVVGVVESIMDPQGFYEGPLTVRKLDGSTPVRENQR
jgi:hypothetical protein